MLLKMNSSKDQIEIPQNTSDLSRIQRQNQPITHGARTIRERIDLYRRFILEKLTGRSHRKLLLVCSFPKSGSTYVMRLLNELTGFPRVYGAEHRGACEQDFSDRVMNSIRYQDGICQQHAKATKHNLDISLKFKLRPVILVRNIYDLVPSLRDHFYQESDQFPTGFVPKEFYGWSEADQITYIIRVHLPWYFNFLISWHEAEGTILTHWITYQNFFLDVVRSVSGMLEFWGVDFSDSEIEMAIQAVSMKDTRLNKGIAGRGALLSEGHRNLIEEIARSCHLSKETASLVGLEGASKFVDLK